MFAALVKWSLRLSVSIALLGLVVMLVPNREALLEATRSIRPLTWLGVLALFLVGQLVMALKWRLLMGPEVGVSTASCCRAHFAGQFSNLFLPGVSGADLVRLLWVVRAGGAKELAIVGSAADRLCDLAALIVLAAGGAAVSARSSPEVGRILLLATILLAAGVLGAIVSLLVLRRLFQHAILERIDGAIARLGRNPLRLAAGFALSLLVQGGYVAANAALGSAAGVGLAPSAWFVAWPLAKIVALAPVSVAGLGVRDLALVFFLEPFGANPPSVTATALAWSSIIVVAALAGGVIAWAPWTALWDKREERAKQPEPRG